MSNTERTLADPNPEQVEPAEASAEFTPEPDAAITDPTEWAAGIRPVRRSAVIYDKGHLLADLDALADQIDAIPEGDDVDALLDQYEALAAQIKTGTKFVAEQRSPDWYEATKVAKIKLLKIRRDKDGRIKSEADARTLMFHMLAEHIVEPVGVTAATIRKIHEVSPKQADRISNLVWTTNALDISSVQMRDFSSRRSPSPSTVDSSDS